jgi:hypothetical protein
MTVGEFAALVEEARSERVDEQRIAEVVTVRRRST